ncbi:MFS transporter [Puniceibacterium sp. IMCC21224]|uniref:MFS transporter n=1 Tax=Puniceibacterium sp. IMCC21224 TaxID=1618204 RepID=UPI00064DE968|nr:MFS transporter [Puniceibacterium sp. IMCC21224]KMK65008.1 arabinose efflux permease family protein [Puniceibacterium sp. IMCC21224]
MSDAAPRSARSERFSAFRHRGFSRYWCALILAGFAQQIQTVAVGWQVYDITRNPLDLGLVGLSQFAPALALVLVTGSVADRLPRRMILGVALAVMSVCAVGLVIHTQSDPGVVWPIFALITVFGAARAFYNPARQALAANIVPPKDLPTAVALITTGNQTATICGPVVGGLLYGISPVAAYGATVICLLAASVLMLSIPKPAQKKSTALTNWKTLSAGFSYIGSNPVVLGALSLDLFAVLLGGAVALLPVYARDVLDVGPAGLGMLRSASAIGAILMGSFLIMRPIKDRAGVVMFIAVAAFGAFTLVFALSEIVWLSVLMLAMMGAADMISVNIRGTLIQLWTPDELRGRVNAVDQVFIGASNELGGFRAGTMAAFIGPVAAVALGGVGTLVVVGLWARLFPDLRRIRSLLQES